MGHNTLREVTTIAGDPYGPDNMDRTAGAWGLGDHGYDTAGEPDITVVAYPDQARMAAANRPLGFDIAMAAAVEVVYTGQEQ